MNKKVVYANETNNLYRLSVIACVLILVFAVLDIVFLHRSLMGVMSKIPVIVVIYLILYFGKKITIRSKENIRHRRKIVEFGEKYEGKIVAVNKHDNFDVSIGATVTAYSLTAEYYSNEKADYKKVDSAILAHTPADVVGNKCIIYEYDGVAIIHEIQNFSNKKMSLWEWEVLMIIIAGFGIALWFCLN